MTFLVFRSVWDVVVVGKSVAKFSLFPKLKEAVERNGNYFRETKQQKIPPFEPIVRRWKMFGRPFFGFVFSLKVKIKNWFF